MTAAHTPGRWIGRSNHVETDGGVLVADVYARSMTHPGIQLEERMANRDLIAAAPDLLAALDHAVDLLRVYGMTEPPALVSSALARARGLA